MRKNLLRVFMIALMLSVVTALAACENEDTAQTQMTLAFGETTYFTQDDTALYPIKGDMPDAGEAIEKEIKIVFSNASKIGLVLGGVSAQIEGLMFCIDGGAARKFETGEIFSKDVKETDTACMVNVKIWLASDAGIKTRSKPLRLRVILRPQKYRPCMTPKAKSSIRHQIWPA
jgi:hypothetical protein